MRQASLTGKIILLATLGLFLALPFLNTYSLASSQFGAIKQKTGFDFHLVETGPPTGSMGKAAFMRHIQNAYLEQHPKASSYDLREFQYWTMSLSGDGWLSQHKDRVMALLLLGVSLGGLLVILPLFRYLPGIRNNGIYHNGLNNRGWPGIALGLLMIVFYILLYFRQHWVVEWGITFDSLSLALNGGKASQWFMYGLLYTIAVLVMGLRFAAKYRHNRYQLIRTGSVTFFQLAFAFLIPQVLQSLHLPADDLKNAWPLNYYFFYDWNIQNHIDAGTIGLFMLWWGIVFSLVAVPLLTYFYGKRWYCSWVCGCGGLAETLGDPFRQQSDKSLRAWQIEHYLIHGVLVFAIIMTLLVLLTYFTGGWGFSYTIRDWYGFLVGSIFAGVVGTGFYPLMGNRVWCRFGCPLAAIMGIVQRYQSRFRITTNGGQCISCGNCSTYCEMGIDVRAYAQRGQDIVRASCVGCGVCSAVCPRGVLRLENASGDIPERASKVRNESVANEWDMG